MLQHVQQRVSMRRNVQQHVSVLQYDSMLQHFMLEYVRQQVSMLQHVRQHVSMLQHVRQHVSMLQHVQLNVSTQALHKIFLVRRQFSRYDY